MPQDHDVSNGSTGCSVQSARPVLRHAMATGSLESEHIRDHRTAGAICCSLTPFDALQPRAYGTAVPRCACVFPSRMSARKPNVN
jgi:hypothetical protein